MPRATWHLEPKREKFVSRPTEPLVLAPIGHGSWMPNPPYSQIAPSTPPLISRTSSVCFLEACGGNRIQPHILHNQILSISLVHYTCPFSHKWELPVPVLSTTHWNAIFTNEGSVRKVEDERKMMWLSSHTMSCNESNLFSCIIFQPMNYYQCILLTNAHIPLSHTCMTTQIQNAESTQIQHC